MWLDETCWHNYSVKKIDVISLAYCAHKLNQCFDIFILIKLLNINIDIHLPNHDYTFSIFSPKLSTEY